LVARSPLEGVKGARQSTIAAVNLCGPDAPLWLKVIEFIARFGDPWKMVRP